MIEKALQTLRNDADFIPNPDYSNGILHAVNYIARILKPTILSTTHQLAELPPNSAILDHYRLDQSIWIKVLDSPRRPDDDEIADALRPLHWWASPNWGTDLTSRELANSKNPLFGPFTLLYAPGRTHLT